MLTFMPTEKKGSSPFAALDAMRDQLPSRPLPVIEKAAPKLKAVVRYERKGHRGKEVTFVEKLGLRASELEIWCGDLKKALGCGGRVEDDAIILQGDLRARLPAVLTAKGVGKITVSG